MSDTAHYRFQSDQAKRLARQVTDAAVREKLLEMAEEYGRYADLIEARATEPEVETVAH
ncbi:MULTISPECIES: hypothetical protein [unclassified Bradyrhizobium]|jgi:hypothetical protein|uniref:hypothetical protein n=1 Tax=unclassified Bradyrhizobium TaxID=2631580 RepID=UPI000AE4CCEB|nr:MULTISPECIES: hypothetical protein [unclassified Bradyrhizobium]